MAVPKGRDEERTIEHCYEMAFFSTVISERSDRFVLRVFISQGKLYVYSEYNHDEGRRSTLVCWRMESLETGCSGFFILCPYERRIVVYKVWQDWIRMQVWPRLLLSCDYRVGKSDQSVARWGLWES